MTRCTSVPDLRAADLRFVAAAAVVGGVAAVGAGLTPVAAAPPAAFRAAAQPEGGGNEAAPAVALAGFTDELPGTALSIEMVPVAAGRVTLDVGGEPKDVHVAPFWIARFETTWDLYDVFVFALDEPEDAAPEGTDGEGADAVTRPSRPYVSPDRGYGHRGYATISVAYRGADYFCRWLSEKTGRRYRLPTEAEWRLACARSGLTPGTLDAHAWCDENADWSPHPVGTKRPDALGLHDLWGNVREWCTGADGKPVALGGSFIDPAAEIGCGARALPTPDWQMTDPQVPKSVWWLSDADFVGFRVVCVPETRKEGDGDAEP